MTRIYRTEAAIERVGLGLLDRSLPKPEWTHAGHFAAALWLLRHRPDLRLETDMPPLIRAYNEATGVANTDTGGYHETITLASIAAARAFLARQGAETPLHEAADRLMAGPLGRPEWLLAYWSKAALFSVSARRRWIAPDLKPFDPRKIG
ncbi:MAG: hypothetical protein ACXWKM_12320 [Phenylobacterium sp.]